MTKREYRDECRAATRPTFFLAGYLLAWGIANIPGGHPWIVMGIGCIVLSIPMLALGFALAKRGEIEI